MYYRWYNGRRYMALRRRYYIITQDESYYIDKPKKKEIKKQLKIIVNQSNTLQDAVNILKDMKEKYLPFNEIFRQRLYIGELCTEQQKTIKHLNYLESFFPKEKHNRFFYLKQVVIPWP